MGRSSKPLLKGLLQKRWESSRVEQHRRLGAILLSEGKFCIRHKPSSSTHPASEVLVRGIVRVIYHNRLVLYADGERWFSCRLIYDIPVQVGIILRLRREKISMS